MPLSKSDSRHVYVRVCIHVGMLALGLLVLDARLMSPRAECRQVALANPPTTSICWFHVAKHSQVRREKNQF